MKNMELNKKAKAFCVAWILILTILFPVFFTVGIVSIAMSCLLEKVYDFCEWVDDLRAGLTVLMKHRFKY